MSITMQKTVSAYTQTGQSYPRVVISDQRLHSVHQSDHRSRLLYLHLGTSSYRIVPSCRPPNQSLRHHLLYRFRAKSNPLNTRNAYNISRAPPNQFSRPYRPCHSPARSDLPNTRKALIEVQLPILGRVWAGQTCDVFPRGCNRTAHSRALSRIGTHYTVGY